MSIAWSDFFQQWNLKIHIQFLPIRLEIKGPIGTVGGEIFQQISALHLKGEMGEQQKVMETQGFFGNPNTSTIPKTSGFLSSQNSGRNIWKVVARQFWLPIMDRVATKFLGWNKGHLLFSSWCKIWSKVKDFCWQKKFQSRFTMV